MMNRILIAVAVALLALSGHAEDNNILRHLSLSAGIGTTGITADLGTMVTDYVGIRGGIDYMPKFKYSDDLELSYINQQFGDIDIPDGVDLSTIPIEVSVEGKWDNSTAHALLDIYPFKSVGFHLTVGAYFAWGDKIVSAYNKEAGSLQLISDFNHRRGLFEGVPDEYGQVAAKLGDYSIMPDDNGNAEAYIQVSKVRPYAGIGFGRAVPGSRLNCQFDLGVQFWGTPKVYDRVDGKRLTAEGTKGEDSDVLKVISKVSVYPVLSLRLSGRLF